MDACGAPCAPGGGVGCLTMMVPNNMVANVVGSGGEVIKQIQANTMTRIVIPPMPDPGSMPPARTVSIYGNPDAQQRAQHSSRVRTPWSCPLASTSTVGASTWWKVHPAGGARPSEVAVHAWPADVVRYVT